MSITFSPTSREVRSGDIWIRGTVAFSSSASGGEPITPSDIEANLSTLKLLKIAPSGSNEFQYVKDTVSSGTVIPVDLTSGISFVSGLSVAGLAFLAIGQAEP